MAIAAMSITLAAGLLAVMPSPSQAADRRPAPRSAAVSLASGGVGRTGAASFIAAGARSRGRGISMTDAGYTSATQLNTRARTRALTGVINDLAGVPFAGACVTATGPSGSARAVSRADGRYMLTGLRPGRYELRAGVCTGARNAGSTVAILWPRQSSMVSVRAGQVATLMPVTVAGASRFPPGTRPASAAAGAATGSISGLVTGHGRPLRGVCVEAQPLGGGPRDFARTSRSGRYRIRNLPPHRYRVISPAWTARRQATGCPSGTPASTPRTRRAMPRSSSCGQARTSRGSMAS